MPVPLTSLRAYVPTYTIFAANTGVGKTVFSASLCRAAVKTPLVSFEREWVARQNAKKIEEELRKVFYIKPVQTGWPVDDDARFVKTYCPEVNTQTLFKYEEPAGAHLCAVREKRPVSDQELLSAAQSAIDSAWNTMNGSPSMIFSETAGGVTSPVMSGTLQASAYRPFRHPTILIGDSNLGGVSTTLSAYESLILRGYTVSALLMFHNGKYVNHESIRHNIDKNVPLYVFPPPPPAPTPRDPRAGPTMTDKMLDATNMMVYYSNMDSGAQEVVTELLESHWKRVENLEVMAKGGEKKVWWPFTQHTQIKSTTVIDSAYGESFTVYHPLQSGDNKATPITKTPGTTTQQYDACASWWTQSLGHAPLPLTLAASSAASRYGHVIFPECMHEPAYALADKLLSTVGNGWADRVFYSDNGSTAVEVAIKAALKVTEKRLDEKSIWQGQELGVVGIEGGYHGDTMGSVDACGPNVYNQEINWYKPRGVWFNPPTMVLKDGQYILRLPKSLSSEIGQQHVQRFHSLTEIFTRSDKALEDLYTSHIESTFSSYQASNPQHSLGALLLEPILLGAGGMQFVDPLFQKALITAARSSSALPAPIPVIYDEIFVGLHRLGMGVTSPGSQLLGHKPDIACYAKNLTGGLVPLAVTLTKESVFGVFEGEGKKEALLHGHSYTAHPVGCEVGRKSLELYEGLVDKEMKRSEKSGETRRHSMPGSVGSVWDEDIVDTLSHLPNVDGVICMGSVLAIELSASDKGYTSSTSTSVITKLRQLNIFARPLGNVVYIMAPFVSGSEGRDRWVAQKVLEVIRES